jgi:hypothetical protein
VANTLDSFRGGAVGLIDWLDLSKLHILMSLSGDKERRPTNHPLLGLPTAMHTAQNIIFFQPLASFGMVNVNLRRTRNLNRMDFVSGR